MIVEESPTSDARLDEVGVGSDPSFPSDSSALCDACGKPATVRYLGLWCSQCSRAEIGPLPAIEWERRWKTQ